MTIKPVTSTLELGTATRRRADSGTGRTAPTRLAEAIRGSYQGRMTQAEIAAALGVAQNTVSRWSTGDVEPRLDDIADLERVLGLPVGYILRSAGYVEDTLRPEDAVAADHRLDPARRELLLAAYRAALRQSRRSVS